MRPGAPAGRLVLPSAPEVGVSSGRAGEHPRQAAPQPEASDLFFPIERPGGRAPCPYNAPRAQQGSGKCQRNPELEGQRAGGTLARLGSARCPPRRRPLAARPAIDWGEPEKQEPSQARSLCATRPREAPSPRPVPVPSGSRLHEPCHLLPPRGVGLRNRTRPLPTCPQRALRTHSSLNPTNAFRPVSSGRQLPAGCPRSRGSDPKSGAPGRERGAVPRPPAAPGAPAPAEPLKGSGLRRAWLAGLPGSGARGLASCASRPPFINKLAARSSRARATNPGAHGSGRPGTPAAALEPFSAD